MKHVDMEYRLPEYLRDKFQRGVRGNIYKPIKVSELYTSFVDFNRHTANLTNQQLGGASIAARVMKLDPNLEVAGLVLSPNGSETARLDEYVQSDGRLVVTERFYSPKIVHNPDDPRSYREKLWALHDRGMPQPYSAEENGRGRIPLITEHPGQWDGRVVFDWKSFDKTRVADLSHVFKLLLSFRMNAPILGICFRDNFYPLHLVPEFTDMVRQPEYYAMDDQRLQAAYRLTSYAERIHDIDRIRDSIKSHSASLLNAGKLAKEARPGFRKGMRKWIKDNETDLANAEYIRQVRNKRGLN